MEHEHTSTHSNGQANRAAGAREAGPAASRENPQQRQGAREPGAKTGTALVATTREFNFNGRRVRAVVKDGEPWFIAADVCAVLEHTNPTKAVLRLDDDEKGLITIQALRGQQEVNVVSESGVYFLILTSRKPEARAFRRWVTGEVLPAIRKTGRYEKTTTADAADGQPRHVLRTTQVELQRYGRFVVTIKPDGKATSTRPNTTCSFKR